MGARSKNFYNDIFAKSGYEAEAKIIQDLYLAGDKKAAEAAIPDDYLAKSSLIGPEGFVKERLYALRESGVTSLNVSFAGADAAQRTAQASATSCSTGPGAGRIPCWAVLSISCAGAKPY